MADDNFIEIHWTSGSLDEARRISRYLAQERYIASAQIIPWIESIYMLDNKLEIIEQNCKYEIPEVLRFKIEEGNKSYMDWLQESTFMPI
jgi:periplasmic divalent cation tolerance protein